eukprot:scaffold5440_cov32-Tisochrysis_lutea.AAC.7
MFVGFGRRGHRYNNASRSSCTICNKHTSANQLDENHLVLKHVMLGDGSYASSCSHRWTDGGLVERDCNARRCRSMPLRMAMPSG